jgi:hypothetical protein
LHGLGHVAYVAHRSLLLERCGDGLWALALGVCASSLPALRLGGLVLLVSSWGSGGRGGCRCGRCCGCGSSGGRRTWLDWSRCGGLGSWDGRNDRTGTGSSRSAASPAHRLGWSSWDRGSLGSSDCNRSWAWDWILGGLNGLSRLLLKLLLGGFRSHSCWGSSSLLSGLNNSSRDSAVCLRLLDGSRLSILLELLLNFLGDNFRLCLLDGSQCLRHLDVSSLLSRCSSGLVVGNSLDDFLLGLLIDVAEDVVEDEVSGGLLSKDESLDELLQLGRLVRGLANDLDDDGLVRALGVDVRNADFAVLEVERLDTLLDGLD